MQIGRLVSIFTGDDADPVKWFPHGRWIVLVELTRVGNLSKVGQSAVTVLIVVSRLKVGSEP